jgi:phosphonate transport system substrate-binding protein
MTRDFLKKGFAAFAMLAVLAVSNQASAEITIKFGVYATDSRSTVESKLRPILGALETDMTKRMGEPVTITIQVAGTYEKGLDDLVEGRVDFARLGPASYVLGKDANPGLAILAMENSKGSKIFNGIIAVAKDSPIKDASELEGKSFAFGNERSTIGRYLSQLHLMENGIRADDLAKYEYLGKHDKVGIAVGRGQFDAGALKESTFKKLVKKGVPIRALASFPNVTKPWVARSGFPSNLETALRQAFLDMKDPAALKALKKDGFFEGSDDDYAIIRQSMEQNKKFFETDTSMN